MKVWSNTRTLDGYVEGIAFTDDTTAAEVALIGGKAIRLDDFPRLRGIFKTGVGRDNVPETEAAARGIACGFPSPATCGIIYEETANFACHLILRTLYADAGDFATWSKRDRPALQSRELLVFGAGNIGGRVASEMRALIKVSTFDALTNRPEELEPLIRKADCISLHVPLLPATRGFFNAEKLAWMKDGAALVNTARGPVVEEAALFAELAAARLRAAFDVFWEEPYKGRLAELPRDRFIVSPHVASTCREFIAATAADFHSFIHHLPLA